MASPPRVPLGPLVTADQAWGMLESKLSSRYTTVRRAFIELDADKDGVINMKEFRKALEIIGMFMSGTEFRKLWKMFDSSGDGNISYAEFNNKIGRLITPANLGLQMNRPETPKLKDWQRKAIAKHMARKVNDIDAAFASFDLDGSGRISQAEFIQALRTLGIRGLGDNETFEMMTRHKKAAAPGTRRASLDDGGGVEMTLDEFRATMAEFFKLSSEPDALDVNGELKEAERILYQSIPRSLGLNTIMNKFKPYDDYRNKEVTHEGFKKTLADFGVKLTENQMVAVLTKADPINDGILDYEHWCVEHMGGKSAAGVMHGGTTIYGAWARLGIRPMTNVVSGKPYTRQELAERFAPLLGFSVAETKLIQSLVGRKQDAIAAFKAFDRDGSGELSPEEFHGVLSHMEADLENSNELVKAMFDRFDSNRNGRIEWVEWWNRVGPFMGIQAGNLLRLGLEKMTPKEMESVGINSQEVQARRDQVSYSEDDLANEIAAVYHLDPLSPRAAARASGAGSPRAAKKVSSSDAMSVATDALDLSSTGSKMKKVLGRAWMSVAQDVQRKAAKGAETAPGSPAKTVHVPGSLLRDALAEKGVALTSKEIRAIASRYPGAANGASGSGGAEGKSVDVEKLFVDAVSGTMVSPKGKAGGRK